MDTEIMNRNVVFHQPARLVFGNSCAEQMIDAVAESCASRAFIITAPAILALVEPLVEKLRACGTDVRLYSKIDSEPTLATFESTLNEARKQDADAVIGIGGGSVLDVAKLVAGLLGSQQEIQDVLGIGKLTGRNCYLICLPTTSGTGSEVSPNAILLDEADQRKKAAVSPHLVADEVYVDPLLTKTVPPDVTAATGMDAMVHCIEAYANRFAHPMVDLYALEGIRLIGNNLKAAFDQGDDVAARANLSLGSLYGGLCLGPVNTGAVHALAYPLGGDFHVAHGISNAVLLPSVMNFNLTAAADRYADIALALGVPKSASAEDTAGQAVEKVKTLMQHCNVPQSLSALGIAEDAIDTLAESALTVQRLLKNNLREVTLEDAKEIYRSIL